MKNYKTLEYNCIICDKIACTLLIPFNNSYKLVRRAILTFKNSTSIDFYQYSLALDNMLNKK